LPRALSLLGIVVRRARTDWPLVLAAWLLLSAATTLVAAEVDYAGVVASGTVRQSILDAGPRDRAASIRVTSAGPADQQVDVALRGILRDAIAGTGGEVVRIVRSGGLELEAPDLVSRRQATLLASYDDIEQHARLVDGRWPMPGAMPVEATLPAAAAARLGIASGQEVHLADSLGRGRIIVVRVVGTWQVDPEDAYWFGNQAELEGLEVRGQFSVHGPFVVAPEALLEASGRSSFDVEWRALPDLTTLQPDRIEALRAGLADVPGRITTTLPPRYAVQVSNPLPALLDRLGRSVLVSGTGIVLVTLQFAFLAAYAIVLVASVLEDRRRPALALLRARGATRRDLATLALGEALLLAGSATVVAPFLAGFVVRAVVGASLEGGVLTEAAASGPAATSFLAALVAGLIAGLVLCLPTLVGLLDRSARLSLGRQRTRTLAQRVGLDLALLAVAIVGLVELRTVGAPLARNVRGALGIDPVLVGAPAIGLFAGALLSVRLVPRAGELAERILTRGRGALAAIGGRQLGRQPLGYARSALLLVLAAALGTFVLSASATWRQSQADQASYQSTGGVRVVTADYPTLPNWSVGAAYRAVAGVETAVGVLEQPASAGRAVDRATLVAFDPATRDGGAGGSPAALPGAAELIDGRPTTPAIDVPGNPSGIRLTVDAELRPLAGGGAGGGPAEPQAGVRISIVIRDADGIVHRIASDEVLLEGNGQQVELGLDGESAGVRLAPARPIGIVAIEAAFSANAGVGRVGSLTIRSAQARDAETGMFKTIQLGPTAAWSWSPPGDPPGSGDVGESRLQDTPQHPISADESGGQPYRWAPPFRVPDALPAIADRQFLDAAGAAVGDEIAVTALAHELRVRIVGSLERLPPFDPAEPWLIVDGPTLAFTAFGLDGTTLRPREWWLAVQPGNEAAVLIALRQPAYATATVTGREDTYRSLTTDPVAVGVLGAMTLSALAAAIFASVGFAVSAAASAVGRLDEFAVIRALGLSGRQVTTWQSLELAFLLGLGVIAGGAVGIGLAMLTLPVATLTQTGTTPVPPPVVVIPVIAFVALGASAVTLLVATLAIVSRVVRAVPVAGVLRARDE
jgi:hypothetical protein